MIHDRVPVAPEAESCHSAHEHNSAGQNRTGQLPEWRLGLLEHLMLVLSSFPSKYVSQSLVYGHPRSTFQRICLHHVWKRRKWNKNINAIWDSATDQSKIFWTVEHQSL